MLDNLSTEQKGELCIKDTQISQDKCFLTHNSDHNAPLQPLPSVDSHTEFQTQSSDTLTVSYLHMSRYEQKKNRQEKQ